MLKAMLEEAWHAMGANRMRTALTPAVFPVALPQHVLETYTDAGDIVFEPFCGSGTTLLAAQRIGRAVRATEIAPEYVDVTVKRFQQNFPEVPVTLVATGQTFDAVATERLGAPA